MDDEPDFTLTELHKVWMLHVALSLMKAFMTRRTWKYPTNLDPLLVRTPAAFRCLTALSPDEAKHLPVWCLQS